MINTRALDSFLRSVERKAFVMAEISTRHTDDALDIVQDAMLSFAKHYAEKDQGDWKPLFYRIVQNKITDYHRKQMTTRRIFAWFTKEKDEEGEPLTMDDFAGDGLAPPETLALKDATQVLVDALKQLPARQQQAFMLRAWEGFSVSETAGLMKCSDGSVKTHYSRAVHALRPMLEDHK